MSEECCGSGCTNCVLDRSSSIPKVSKEGCENVINQNYTKFKLKLVEKCTINTYQLTFQWIQKPSNDDKTPVLSIPGGAHLMLRAPRTFPQEDLNPVYAEFKENLPTTVRNADFKGKSLQKHDTTEEDIFISRPYTPVLIDAEHCEFTILLKLEPFGQMSAYIRTLQVGAITEWKGIYNNIPSTIKTADRIICFSHGVSIAPFYTLAKELTEDEGFEGNIELYACFKDMKSILLRDELIQLNGYWNFKSSIVLSRERHINEICKKNCDCTKNSQKYNEKLIFGRLDQNFLQKVFQIPSNEKILLLICGTQNFTATIHSYFRSNKNIQVHIL